MEKIRKLYYLFLQLWSNRTREKYAKIVGVKVGKDCRLYSANFGSEPYLISIGDRVTVTEGVYFLTHDGGLSVLRDEFVGADFFRPIIIYLNCFIGVNTIILPGVSIGPNSVVGAGAVVSKSIPPDSVAVGVPAKVIGSLESYKRHINKDFLTHELSHKKKKEYLVQYFGETVEEWLEKMKQLEETVENQ